MSENYIKQIGEAKVFPIIRCNNPEKAIEISKSLIKGGIKILEININNPSLYEAIKEVSKYATVCAGGIITSIQAEAAQENGAKLLSSPIFQMNMVKISKNKQIPFIAGASTANEAYNAWKCRIPLIKLFPTDAMGGVQYIEDILRQMPFLNLMPMGKIKLEQVEKYINAGSYAVGVGRDFYKDYSMEEITERTQNFLNKIKDIT